MLELEEPSSKTLGMGSRAGQAQEWCSGTEKPRGLGLTKPRGYSRVTRLACGKSSQWAGTSSAGNQTSGERLDAAGAYFRPYPLPILSCYLVLA